MVLPVRDRKGPGLHFLIDFEVRLTNRLTKQDLRMIKLQTRIPGCFRTRRSARDFATLCRVLSTVR